MRLDDVYSVTGRLDNEFDDNILCLSFNKYFVVDMKRNDVGIKVPAGGTVKPEYRKGNFPPSIHQSNPLQPSCTTPTMPTKLRTAVHKSLLHLAGKNSGSGVGITAEGTVFYCPSCSTWRRRMVSAAVTTNNYRTRNGGLRHVFHSNRHIDTTTTVRRYLSSSAVRSNALASADVNKNVPARFRELYAALTELEAVAADHISLSRLQLAQRGLESEDHVVRVAGISPFLSLHYYRSSCLILGGG